MLVWGAALVFAWQAAAPSSYAADRSFFDLCSTALARVDEFAKECVANARPLHRTFEASGQPVPELHYFYISPSIAAGHFALGCRLDREKRITFLGLYYAVKGEIFGSANSDRLLFVDFNGNAGTFVDGKMRVMLAAWPLLPNRAGSANASGCGDPDSSLGRVPKGNGYTTYKVSLNGRRAQIEACHRPAMPGSVETCYRQESRAFGPQASLRIVYERSPTILINELGGAYISDQSFEKICAQDGRSSIEAVNIAKEICADLEPK